MFLFPSEPCDALASMYKQISTNYVNQSALSTFTACRLIALNNAQELDRLGLGKWHIIYLERQFWQQLGMIFRKRLELYSSVLDNKQAANQLCMQ